MDKDQQVKSSKGDDWRKMERPLYHKMASSKLLDQDSESKWTRSEIHHPSTNTTHAQLLPQQKHG